jgi:aspartate racemase
MKHIGIVACSAEGAALCYQAICREALTLVGKNDHPRVTLDSIPMAAWMPAFDAGDYAGVAGFMLASARVLAAAGADFAVCPDNSAHLAWDHVQAQTPIPWLHIARVVGEEAAGRGFRRVGILGTRFTMAGPVYRDALGALGIDIVVPEQADFAAVDRIIFDELVDGVFTDASRETYNAVIARLKGRGCDAVALACTEIPLLVRPAESPLPTLDSTRLLAAAAVREALAGAPAPRIVDARSVLAVQDLALSTRFYVEQLGFRRDPIDADGWSFLTRDGFKVMLGECADAPPAGSLGDHSYFAYLRVRGVDALHRELSARGVEALAPPADKPWGLREFTLRTPDGHRVTFGEPWPVS